MSGWLKVLKIWQHCDTVEVLVVCENIFPVFLKVLSVLFWEHASSDAEFNWNCEFMNSGYVLLKWVQNVKVQCSWLIIDHLNSVSVSRECYYGKLDMSFVHLGHLPGFLWSATNNLQ